MQDSGNTILLLLALPSRLHTGLLKERLKLLKHGLPVIRSHEEIKTPHSPLDPHKIY